MYHNYHLEFGWIPCVFTFLGKKDKANLAILSLPYLFNIGKTGFEPATPWSQTKCSTKLSYFPQFKCKKKENNAPERSRTPNLLIRSQTLYPIELRAQYLINAEGRNRTGTVITHRRILSPVRLPVPPPRLKNWLKRKTGFEPATPTLARWCSTTELFPQFI